MSEANKPVLHMSTGRPEAGRFYAGLYDAAQSELAALREELDNERTRFMKTVDQLATQLAAAEQRNVELVELLREVISCRALSTKYPLWQKISAVIKPTESGASE